MELQTLLLPVNEPVAALRVTNALITLALTEPVEPRRLVRKHVFYVMTALLIVANKVASQACQLALHQARASHVDVLA